MTTVMLRGVTCSGNRVVTLLREFGVIMPRSKRKLQHGGGFWIRNEDDLEGIFHDFQQAARKLKQKLHPDNGGDAKAFAILSEKCEFIERRFAAHIPSLQNSLDYMLRAERAKATSIAHKQTKGRK